MNKAVGTRYIPKQGKELQKSIDEKITETEVKEIEKDEFEVWMDGVGQAVTALAIVLGLLLLIVNIPRFA